jgi:hypothetical protein
MINLPIKLERMNADTLVIDEILNFDVINNQANNPINMAIQKAMK